MKRKPTLRTAKAKAWKAFSRYIRLKYSKQGICECVTCGKVAPWTDMQAGHGIPGRGNSILFVEEAVRPQCVGCNMFAGGAPHKFVRLLIEWYGLDGYDELMALSKRPRKFYVHELIEWAEGWEAEAERMETELQ